MQNYFCYFYFQNAGFWGYEWNLCTQYFRLAGKKKYKCCTHLQVGQGILCSCVAPVSPQPLFKYKITTFWGIKNMLLITICSYLIQILLLVNYRCYFFRLYCIIQWKTKKLCRKWLLNSALDIWYGFQVPLYLFEKRSPLEMCSFFFPSVALELVPLSPAPTLIIMVSRKDQVITWILLKHTTKTFKAGSRATWL